MIDYYAKKPKKNCYGRIEFLYQKGIAETLYYKNKKAFEKEIKESNEIGRPIDTALQNDIELGL